MKVGLLVGLLFTCSLAGAQTPELSQHFFQYPALNPAETGTLGQPVFNAAYNRQFSSHPGAQSSQYAGFHAPLSDRNIGLGLWVSHASYFVTSQTNLFASYAYHIRNDEYLLSLGLQAGFTQYNFSFSDVELLDPDDPAFGNDFNTGILANTGVGIKYATSKYVLSIATPRLIQHSFQDQGLSSEYLENRSVNFYTLYHWTISPQLTLIPYAYFSYTEDQTSDFVVSLLGEISNTFLGGLSMNKDTQWTVFLALGVSENLRFGYAYEFGKSNASINQASRHEIGIRYAFTATSGAKYPTSPYY
ncbi:PorP/SprF family type IX secretion system membrane protein [Roseivirga sp. BDSF3-8]|uniref:PorP/SprF family type IX secretion system membrane protein n=1 Tax=Roseivirga sp. BDSF3-8 TaxID=3241598 RepID=UPI0035317FC1